MSNQPGEVNPDGVAAAAGLTTAMKIVSVGGTPTDGLTEAEASKLVAGKESVTVRVKYDPVSTSVVQLRAWCLLCVCGACCSSMRHVWCSHAYGLATRMVQLYTYMVQLNVAAARAISSTTAAPTLINNTV